MTMRPLALLLLLLGACQPAPDPEPLTPALESLRGDQYDPRHGLEYWTGRLDERSADSEWDRAVSFCRDRNLDRHPNCRTVQLLYTASQIPGFPRGEAGR